MGIPSYAHEDAMIFHLDHKEQWEPVVRQWRNEGQTIVTTNGTFDIIHVGHVKLLREARAQGDKLVLGLNSDISVKQYKSVNRPIVPQEERAAMLEAIRYVDLILIFDEPESLRFVREVRPDVHVKDSSYGYNLIEAPIVREYGGRIHLVEKTGHSTTNIIEKVLEVYRKEGG
ncbi:MAG TPA: adenylyltransferase/cytidyltransferase family protein [bacterium]|nr:adenylyltransferase/cytidyltransferase family protein [Candidatus Omnitrophota bacterium]HOL95755.1 adenylyltransferase/cytidyltransferase family protein [bacterium]HPP00820.1 adenylyltransferase/cytidyltransferase family protein [bacterium]